MTLFIKHFSPEFLNRIDAIVFFSSLNQKAVEEIARIQIKILQKRLAAKDVTLHVSDKVLIEIAERGYVKEFGARPLKRAIQQHIMVPITQYLLKASGSKKNEYRI